MPEMTAYKTQYFPLAFTEHGSFKAKIWKLKKKLRSGFFWGCFFPFLNDIEDYHIWLHNNFSQPELFCS